MCVGLFQKRQGQGDNHIFQSPLKLLLTSGSLFCMNDAAQANAITMSWHREALRGQDLGQACLVLVHGLGIEMQFDFKVRVGQRFGVYVY